MAIKNCTPWLAAEESPSIAAGDHAPFADTEHSELKCSDQSTKCSHTAANSACQKGKHGEEAIGLLQETILQSLTPNVVS